MRARNDGENRGTPQSARDYVSLQDPWYQEMWGERAAIRQYDGEMVREEAENAALADMMRYMRSRQNG